MAVSALQGKNTFGAMINFIYFPGALVKKGDLVVLRADKVYEDYGKPVPYYMVISTHAGGVIDMQYDHNEIVTIHNPNTKDTIAVFANDLILLSNV